MLRRDNTTWKTILTYSKIEGEEETIIGYAELIFIIIKPKLI